MLLDHSTCFSDSSYATAVLTAPEISAIIPPIRAEKPAVPEPKPVPAPAPPADMLPPLVAAVAMQPEFRSMARYLSPRDPHTQDDLVQEMAMSVLLCEHAHKRAFFRAMSLWRAKDCLRRWRSILTREEAEAQRRKRDLARQEDTHIGNILTRILNLD